MITNKGTQYIKTKKLILRKFTIDDAQNMFDNWANDERVTKYLTWEPHGRIENTKELLKIWCDAYNDLSTYNWAIEYEGKAIGGISIVRRSDTHEYAEIGYCLGYDFWNKGIMTEAVSAVIDFMFEEVNVNKICISHATKNPASGRVAQKCKLSLEGIKRQDFKSTHGEFLDIAIYSILRSEWLKIMK